MGFPTRAAGAAVAVLVLLYAGDALVASRRPKGTVNVAYLYEMKFKNGRAEYDFDHAEDQPCADSLLPHGGVAPCWYLRRHRQQIICCE